ncbi:glycosyltransferase family 2 protein [uncultured Aquimarina sp.]|uniref:glycosyltransferase family 2 protein n=1 Tax=uncultured Aquimarina sp. TaxID=575652 RepID=UPI0026034E71|nr:glycosyltransferase family 2 protein [uncultured Aquimarina sp.]
MKLSVVILNYNVRYFLELCILSVQKAITTLDAEIIVIDNNSPDDSCAMVRERFPDSILIENKENIGFSKANNQGVAVAKGEYICILNPDTVVAEDTFINILEIFKDLPSIGMAGPKLISGVGVFHPESKRNIPSPLTSFGRLFKIRLGKVKNYYSDHIPIDGIGNVDILVGAFILVKKENYKSVGGFDEDYFMYGEDIDLSYKIKKKGLENYYIGTIPVIHYKGESTDRNAEYIKRFYGAMRLFYQKHFRSNWFLDFVVSVGIRLTSVMQSFKNNHKEKRVIDRYYLVSENNKLKQKLTNVLQKEVQFISLESADNLGYTNNELIFDNELVSFSEIISSMQRLKKSNMTFKIRPIGCNFILGSDFSDGKGEVITF